MPTLAATDYSLYTTRSPGNLSHEKLGRLEDQICEIVEKNLKAPTAPEAFGKVLAEMNIQPIDQRIQAQWELAKKLHHPFSNFSIKEMKKKPGIFLLIDESNHPFAVFKPGSQQACTEIDESNHPFAVFKPGSQRACTENAIKGLAEILGLGKHFVECRFAVLASQKRMDDAQAAADRREQQQNLEKSRKSFFGNVENDEELKTENNIPKATTGIIVKTWKSQSLEYLKKPNAMVGIIEPFISTPFLPKEAHSEETDLSNYTKMLLLLLVAGVRDAKEDGQSQFVFFDADDAFPRRIDPIVPDATNSAAPSLKIALRRQPAQTDMPILSDFAKLNDLNLPEELLTQLTNLILSWNENAILEFLKSQKIQFPDSIVEQHNPLDLDSFQDETGSSVQLAPMPAGYADPNDLVATPDQRLVSQPLSFDTSEDCMFKKEQLIALFARIRRIRCLFLANQRLTTREPCVQASDNEFDKKELKRAGERLKTNGNKITPFLIVRFLDPYFDYLIEHEVSPETVGRQEPESRTLTPCVQEQVRQLPNLKAKNTPPPMKMWTPPDTRNPSAPANPY